MQKNGCLHMSVPTNAVEGKMYELNYYNACMLIVEAAGKTFIENVASCGCPTPQYNTRLNCKSCATKQAATERTGTGAKCKCSVGYGISPLLLGTTRELMILKKYSCTE